MASVIRVTKRNGQYEPVIVDKFNKVVQWACEGINSVSASMVALNSQVQFYDKIKTSDLMETSIKAAADLISEENPGYQYVAGRLINYHLRKQVYGQYTPIDLYSHINNVVKIGYYDKDVLTWYSKEEIDTINSYINHERDFAIAYAGMEQFRGKYLIKNRVNGEIYETPQMAYILISMFLFRNYSKATRLTWVKDFYDAISNFEISLPTPIMGGLRSPQKQFSSCVLIESDDSLNSINATSSAIVKYVSQKAGIGIGASRIRAIGSKIRNGDASHTGVIPFFKLFQAAVKSCSQGGIRGGAATLYTAIWHLEIEDIIVLKNNKGTEDNRVRHLDYGIQFNKVMYERLLTDGVITLFNPNDVPDLHEAFYKDTDKFRELYVKYEKDSSIRKKSISAIELFSSFMQERKDTGRIYLMNVDHVNDHSPFITDKAPIKMSNLCAEIALPTKPLNDINDGSHYKRIRITAENYAEYRKYKLENNGLLYLNKEKFKGGTTLNSDWLFELVDESSDDISNGDIFEYADVEDYNGSEIALCTLAAINWGKIKSPSDFERLGKLSVRALNELLDYQDYPVKAAQIATMNRRPLGVGIINFAYWLAKNDLTYQNIDSDGLAKIHEYTEAWSYYLIKASVELAKETGACFKSDETLYNQGIMPIDTYKKDVDDLVAPVYYMDWDSLREDAKKYGIKNSTLMALMPSESSAQVSNATNGIEPARSLVSVKQSKDGVLKQVVPEVRKLKKKYDLLWDQRSPVGYLKICAVLQKFIDQTISANTSYNPKFYPDEQIPMSEMLQHLLMFYKLGGKTLYYFNTQDSAGEFSEKDIAAAVGELALGELDESECESCTI